MLSDDLSGIERGDTVLLVTSCSQPRAVTVEAAGARWITAGSHRFSRVSGRRADGGTEPRIETVAGHAERAEQRALAERMHPWGWIPAAGQHQMTTGQMRRAATLLAEFEAEEAGCE
jgi:hypothetical protein